MKAKLASLFTPHAVLQRRQPIRVWGWAAPGAPVEINLADRHALATADKTGAWSVALPALEAGGPHELVVRSAGQKLSIADVLIGEVWVCSGQSNMEMHVADANDAEREIADAQHSGIRLFTVPRRSTLTPQADAKGHWRVCSPEAVRSFSAAGYFFGRDIHARTGVPVGLIDSSWGGTVAEAWTRREVLLGLPEVKGGVEAFERDMPDWERWYGSYFPEDPGSTGPGRDWGAPGAVGAEWGELALPCYWQDRGMDFNGVVWFRREMELPAEWAGKDLVLALGVCDDFDHTYFNGALVGSTGIEQPASWCFPRAYTVPGALVKGGRNTIAVRVLDYSGRGGLAGDAARMFVRLEGAPDAEAIPLAGVWRCRVEHNLGHLPSLMPGNQNAPYGLFCGMIAPLIPYGIRGVIWYQGESNADRAHQYAALFMALIRDWRRQWGQGDFPFLFAQLAAFGEMVAQPQESHWAELREAQAAALRLPNTGMAVAIDIGDAQDVHPKNKQELGRRLALWALLNLHGCRDLVCSGPVFRAMQVAGSRVRLHFDPVSGELQAKGGKLRGFALAGRDGRYVWADADIEGETVVLSCIGVARPVAVRYGWADNPDCNLYNSAGLPAAPFRAASGES